MKSVSCLERERLWRNVMSLLGLAAWCGIAATVGAPTCLAQAAPSITSVKGPSDAEPTPVYVVDDAYCIANGKSEHDWSKDWSEEEHWAWEQICKHLPVDFDEKKANDAADRVAARGTPRHVEEYDNKIAELRRLRPQELATDESRTLRGHFLSKVFGQATLRSYSWKEPLRFAGFNTDKFVIDTASLKSLDLRHAHIGSFLIQNATVDGGLRLENVYSGSIKLKSATAKNILLNRVTLSENGSQVVGLGSKQPPFKAEEQDGTLVIDTVRIDDRLAVLEGDYGAMSFTHMKVDDLFIYQPTWIGTKSRTTPDLSITESVDNGVFTLEVNPKSLPARIRLNQFIFANAYLGPNPMPVIDAMDVDAKSLTKDAGAKSPNNDVDVKSAATVAEAKSPAKNADSNSAATVGEAKSPAKNADTKSAVKSAEAKSPTIDRPDLEPYALIAKSFSDRGENHTSDRILIAMNERNRELAWKQSLPDWARLTLLYWLVTYGFEPEWGFVYIFIFVLVGWAVFWRNSDRLKSEYKPTTWFPTLLLAFDSVIPGIQLDKNNLDVRYDGWPQPMLYLLRLLGAFLVAIAYSFLQKRLFG